MLGSNDNKKRRINAYNKNNKLQKAGFNLNTSIFMKSIRTSTLFNEGEMAPPPRRDTIN